MVIEGEVIEPESTRERAPWPSELTAAGVWCLVSVWVVAGDTVLRASGGAGVLSMHGSALVFGLFGLPFWPAHLWAIASGVLLAQEWQVGRPRSTVLQRVLFGGVAVGLAVHHVVDRMAS